MVWALVWACRNLLWSVLFIAHTQCHIRLPHQNSTPDVFSGRDKHIPKLINCCYDNKYKLISTHVLDCNFACTCVVLGYQLAFPLGYGHMEDVVRYGDDMLQQNMRVVRAKKHP